MIRTSTVPVCLRFLPTFIASVSMAVLSACSVQPNEAGGYNVLTPTLGQLLSGAASGASVSSNSGAPPVTTKYIGPVDGGTGTLTVAPLGNGQYQIELGAMAGGGTLGGGGVSGIIEPNGKSDGGYILTQISDGGANPLPCALDVNFNRTSAQISEDFGRDKEGCMGYHGAALSFDGILTKQN